ncbi:uncharacterized protein LY79DRAFT_584653 [Colletotrichum navitas]|uniref:Uncharacterized protein n=1 Tax=Colletotrichum navitas TaxID=681940 RepID=A0AAD8PLU7_9PEZI|nr:uncharacterized protein LY79DRAFT_584653 [Colletotrichum navitas]KAK1569543.1 hypothetical protein LY79DRAFT_584653 [Colletotrichum navitas]
MPSLCLGTRDLGAILYIPFVGCQIAKICHELDNGICFFNLHGGYGFFGIMIRANALRIINDGESLEEESPRMGKSVLTIAAIKSAGYSGKSTTIIPYPPFSVRLIEKAQHLSIHPTKCNENHRQTTETGRCRWHVGSSLYREQHTREQHVYEA